jgi:hypothetical protein
MPPLPPTPTPGPPIDMSRVVGSHDVLFVTLDSLRHDVAQRALARGETPGLRAVLPPGGWEMRQTPGTFTLPAHQAFFAGFLPTPVAPGRHTRLMAVRFPGSVTTGPTTAVFDAPDVIAGWRAAGYLTICIGGVGFFDPRSPLGGVLPAYFDEAHYHPRTGVRARAAAANQVATAIDRLAALPAGRRVLMFVNVPSTHRPTRIFVDGARRDSPATQAAALRAVDAQLPPLIDAMRRRADLLLIIGADHGEAFGEDGYFGHRIAHPAVTTVPWAERLLPRLRVT